MVTHLLKIAGSRSHRLPPSTGPTSIGDAGHPKCLATRLVLSVGHTLLRLLFPKPVYQGGRTFLRVLRTVAAQPEGLPLPYVSVLKGCRDLLRENQPTFVSQLPLRFRILSFFTRLPSRKKRTRKKTVTRFRVGYPRIPESEGGKGRENARPRTFLHEEKNRETDKRCYSRNKECLFFPHQKKVAPIIGERPPPEFSVCSPPGFQRPRGRVLLALPHRLPFC